LGFGLGLEGSGLGLGLDFLVSDGLGLEGSGLGLGYWWTCYKSGNVLVLCKVKLCKTLK